MKILIGSHGVGKTTLLKEVNKRFDNYYVTDGFSRPVFRISKVLDLSEEEKQVVINELTTWGYLNYLKHKNVICTRSIIDCIIYAKILNPGVKIKEMEDLFEQTKDQVEWFFYIPVEFEMDDSDGYRLSLDIQKKVDNVIKEFIKNNIPSEKVVVLSGNIDERLEKISKYL